MAMNLRLSDEHPVKRVAVMRRQCARRKRVFRCDDEHTCLQFGEVPGKACEHAFRSRELAERVFDTEFPRTDARDV